MPIGVASAVKTRVVRENSTGTRRYVGIAVRWKSEAGDSAQKTTERVAGRSMMRTWNAYTTPIVTRRIEVKNRVSISVRRAARHPSPMPRKAPSRMKFVK